MHELQAEARGHAGIHNKHAPALIDDLVGQLHLSVCSNRSNSLFQIKLASTPILRIKKSTNLSNSVHQC